MYLFYDDFDFEINQFIFYLLSVEWLRRVNGKIRSIRMILKNTARMAKRNRVVVDRVRDASHKVLKLNKSKLD